MTIRLETISLFNERHGIREHLQNVVGEGTDEKMGVKGGIQEI